MTEEEEAYLKEIEKKSSFISFFIPRKGFIATPILLDLNLLIFILMVAFGVGILEPSTLALLKWGADFGPLTLTGDWWRAITCNFTHIGGLLSGFLLGIIYVISYRFEKKDAQRTISIVGELGIFGIFLFSFLGLCQNIPSTYREIRKEWESGIVEAYLNGELEEENDNQPATNTPSKSSTLQMPPYTPVGNNDTWLSFYDATTNFSCQYPTNWHKITGARGLTPTAEPPFLMLVNGGNQLTAVALTYDTRKEFERVKELTLLLPRNANGEPSEDYKQSNVTIHGLSMTQTSNPLHIGAPDEPGHDVQQIALRYFQEDQLRVFSIVMLVYDKEAQADLEAIVSSIQITK